jgi:hypothetical protein
MRWVSAAAFAAVMAAVLYVVPDGWAERHETASSVGLIVVYFSCGVLIGRGWALIVAFLPVVLAVPLGDQGDADGTPVWWWVLVDTAVIFVWVTLAGVLAGRLGRAWRRRHSRAGSARLSPRLSPGGDTRGA